MGATLSSKCCGMGKSRRNTPTRQIVTPSEEPDVFNLDRRHIDSAVLDGSEDNFDITSDDIARFHSFEREETRLISCVSYDATPSTATTAEDGLHVTASKPRQSLKCGRSGESYGYRDRIPSNINMSTHDSEYWWSAANLTRPAIAHDLGMRPAVLSRPIKVTVVPSSFFASHRDIEVFPEYLALCRTLRFSPSRDFTDAAAAAAAADPAVSRSPTNSTSPRGIPQRVVRLLIFKLKMGEQVMVSLNEVIDDANFDAIFRESRRDELLKKKLKFIMSPINLPLPIPAKQPNEAETVGSYFGMDNVDLYIDEAEGQVRVASILVNIYAKWMIRKFLPLVTSSIGRICDFILLSSDDKLVFADFRLLATEVSQAMIKGNSPPQPNK